MFLPKVIMPDVEELTRRLTDVDNDSRLVRMVYPLVVHVLANQHRDGCEVASAIALAIVRSATSAEWLDTTMLTKLRPLVEAAIVDDQHVIRADALRFVDGILSDAESSKGP